MIFEKRDPEPPLSHLDIKCNMQTFKFHQTHTSNQAQNYNVKFRIKDSTIFDDANPKLQLKVYECESKDRPNDCSTCVNDKLTQNYNCLWCDGQCRYGPDYSAGQCSKKYVEDELGAKDINKCEAPDERNLSVEPSTGPINGNTLITIRSKNLAIEESQIRNIFIGDKPCEKWSFVNPSEITCVVPAYRRRVSRRKDGATSTTTSYPVKITIDSKSYNSKVFSQKFTYINVTDYNVTPTDVIESGQSEITLKGYGVGAGRIQKFQIYSDAEKIDEGFKDECDYNGSGSCKLLDNTNLSNTTNLNVLSAQLPKKFDFIDQDLGIKYKPKKRCKLEIDKKTIIEVPSCLTVHKNPSVAGYTEPTTCISKTTDCVKSYVSGGGIVQFILQKSATVNMWSRVGIYLKFKSNMRSEEHECSLGKLDESLYETLKNRYEWTGHKRKSDYFMAYNCPIPKQPDEEIIETPISITAAANSLGLVGSPLQTLSGNYRTGQGEVFLKIDNYEMETNKIIMFFKNPKLINPTTPTFKECDKSLKEPCNLVLKPAIQNADTKADTTCAQCSEVAGWSKKRFRLVYSQSNADFDHNNFENNKVYEMTMANSVGHRGGEGEVEKSRRSSADIINQNVYFNIEKDLVYGTYDLEFYFERVVKIFFSKNFFSRKTRFFPKNFFSKPKAAKNP